GRDRRRRRLCGNRQQRRRIPLRVPRADRRASLEIQHRRRGLLVAVRVHGERRGVRHRGLRRRRARPPRRRSHRDRRAAETLMDAFLTYEGFLALVTLTVLEIVLGVDNVIFISILSAKLPVRDQPRARRLGLFAAMLMRIALLFSIGWVVRLTAPLV